MNKKIDLICENSIVFALQRSACVSKRETTCDWWCLQSSYIAYVKRRKVPMEELGKVLAEQSGLKLLLHSTWSSKFNTPMIAVVWGIQWQSSDFSCSSSQQQLHITVCYQQISFQARFRWTSRPPGPWSGGGRAVPKYVVHQVEKILAISFTILGDPQTLSLSR